ncbi:GspE/PulE family protein [Geitlerinema sp. PCC 9228]|jgi:type IV pilus assembly protein PilB|uniref:GspE/PulE family protein n=1 Tax=Geitlerinema sp. PCC 9228 TaxID=111611 RepID=UPI0008F99854|nr:GspE/PulE family protein [Geitlerinema sp. PCC 9228]
MSNFTPQRRALVKVSNFSPFGNRLIEAGYVNTEQMQEALTKSRKTGKPLVEILKDITGKPLPPELLRQYRKQQLFELKIVYGVEACDPEINEDITSESVGELVHKYLPLDVCRNYQLLPLHVEGEGSSSPRLCVAMVDPDNLEAQDKLRQTLRSVGMGFTRRAIAQEDYQNLMQSLLDEQVKKQEEAKKPTMDLELNPDAFEEVELAEAPDEGGSEVDLEQALSEADTAPIIKTVNQILAKALKEGMSDIHIEPQEEFLQVRMRKDGVLQKVAEFPKKIVPALTSRFKIISDMDIAERRQAQDGRIRRTFQGRTVDFRVNCLPSRYGEKIVLRILDNSSTQLGLDKLITDPETLSNVRETANRPFGMILVTGPTGSGKSTTLYSILAERNEPGVNISTAEDPIEYALPGITQVQVIREKDLTFANVLRAFLRQDPDIILVGETRDKETAKTAIEAALTGHLVLTTLHTNDASGAIARLDEMGVEPFMISGALLGVLAQRLMRRVCSECRIPYHPSPEELARYGLSASQETEATFYKANTIPPEERQALREQNQLCPKCNGGGYKGRVGVYEFLSNSEKISNLINEGAPTSLIKETAVEEGMKTLLSYSLNLVREGYTTFEEVERVTFTDTGLESEMKAKRKSSLTCKTCQAQLQPEWLDCPYCLTPRFQD